MEDINSILEVNYKSLIESSKMFDYSSQVSNGKYGLKNEIVNINDNNASIYFNKPIGKYMLISLKSILMANSKQKQYYAYYIKKRLNEYIENITSKTKIMVVGLGNRFVVSDCLGDLVINNINVNRHLKKMGFKITAPEVSAFCPSVMGKTGIESFTIINEMVKNIKPDYVIIIDSLCASNIDRLGTNIQISSAGITPGAGVNNAQKILDEKSLRCKIISIGVPLMTYAKTYIKSELENNEIDLNLLKTLLKKNNLYDNFKSVFNILKSDFNNVVITPNDINELVKISANIISNAINLLCGTLD